MASKKPSRPAQTHENTLRIIGGKWRGRKLRFPDVEGLRPTGDRLRETLFNWLAPIVVDAHCLDLFAGSGALGLEAVSRGAASATLIEQSKVASQTLLQHRQTLDGEGQIEVIQADALRWLEQTPPRAFDLLFLDPPFNTSLLEAAIALLEKPGWLAPGARIYMESARQQVVSCPESWRQLRSIETGQVHCQLFRIGDA
jgi:16S rRNA (guanine966-N2)-methyltransferase